MRPPLERPGECHADCVGSAGLTVDEQLQIGLFSDEVESEYGAAQVKDPRRQYVICPHVDLFRSEDQTVTVSSRNICTDSVAFSAGKAGVFRVKAVTRQRQAA